MLDELRVMIAAVENADPREWPFCSRGAVYELQVAATELAMALDGWAWEENPMLNPGP
jgi:hypothetical protein